MKSVVSSLEFIGADEIAIRLAPVLEDLNAEAAFLGGPYIHAVRNKDPREDDELVLHTEKSTLHNTDLKRQNAKDGNLPPLDTVEAIDEIRSLVRGTFGVTDCG